jgi:hypothetical protein
MHRRNANPSGVRKKNKFRLIAKSEESIPLKSARKDHDKEAFGLAAKMDAAIATTGAVSGRADQSGGFPHRSHADHDRARQLSRAGASKFQCRQQNPKKPIMSTFIKSTIIALALAAGQHPHPQIRCWTTWHPRARSLPRSAFAPPVDDLSVGCWGAPRPQQRLPRRYFKTPPRARPRKAGRFFSTSSAWRPSSRPFRWLLTHWNLWKKYIQHWRSVESALS